MYKILIPSALSILFLGSFQAPQDPAPFGQWMPTLARQSMRPLRDSDGLLTREILPLLTNKPFLPSNSHDDPDTWLPPAMVQDGRYQRGKTILLQKCASCHDLNVRRMGTGPALVGVTRRYDRKWLYAFTRDSQKMIQAGDPLAVASYNKYGGSIMNPFPNLTDADLSNLYFAVDILELRGLVEEEQQRMRNKVVLKRVTQ